MPLLTQTNWAATASNIRKPSTNHSRSSRVAPAAATRRRKIGFILSLHLNRARLNMEPFMVDNLPRLNEVFRNVFDDDEIDVTRETTAKDVEGWDSLMHVTLIVNVEKAFGIKFTSSEVASLKSVGDLVDLIDARALPK
jgi:acyl carrier protein